MDQGKRLSFLLRWLVLFLLLVTSSCQLFGRSETACGPSTLQIGEVNYEIKTIKPKSDGSLNIPENKPDNAFWVEGTTTNQVFGLSPTDNNLALPSSLETGDEIQVNWENCNSGTYHLSSLQTGVPENASLLDQSTTQVTIFVRTDDPSTGFVAVAELTEETINVSNTPDTSIPQVEISILNTTASQDGQTVEIETSILNYGSPIKFSTDHVTLLSENMALKLNSSEPALPFEINSGETATFKLIFPHPASPTAVLQILGIEYEISGY